MSMNQAARILGEPGEREPGDKEYSYSRVRERWYYEGLNLEFKNKKLIMIQIHEGTDPSAYAFQDPIQLGMSSDKMKEVLGETDFYIGPFNAYEYHYVIDNDQLIPASSKSDFMDLYNKHQAQDFRTLDFNIDGEEKVRTIAIISGEASGHFLSREMEEEQP
ncbi:hypothetical protein DNH61_04520 [Paenibacillus sambharensis]|uniref:Uncharacterized protein n=1 Tax=Paenibacillus sambharensis TaxID=1803190 RepID=A0A2W1M0A2_9BACL|nr:hypothetical protein [Paenibacillus sambharensis]PZD97157.1 hypothetical protein DNH61_04520 [Paenibacillus sambharensis]